eukprot:1190146-Prorocentrum_minimum.AAC.6
MERGGMCGAGWSGAGQGHHLLLQRWAIHKLLLDGIALQRGVADAARSKELSRAFPKLLVKVWIRLGRRLRLRIAVENPLRPPAAAGRAVGGVASFGATWRIGEGAALPAACAPVAQPGGVLAAVLDRHRQRLLVTLCRKAATPPAPASARSQHVSMGDVCQRAPIRKCASIHHHHHPCPWIYPLCTKRFNPFVLESTAPKLGSITPVHDVTAAAWLSWGAPGRPRTEGRAVGTPRRYTCSALLPAPPGDPEEARRRLSPPAAPPAGPTRPPAWQLKAGQ